MFFLLKNRTFIFSITLAVMTSFFSNAYAEEDQAIEATAALLFHVNEELSPSVESAEDLPKITFESHELYKLWTQAITLDPSLNEAKDAYWSWQANSTAPESRLELERCANLLKSIWLSENEKTDEKISHFVHQYSLNHLINNPLSNKKIKKEIAPYLLPNESSIKPTLDHIFSSSRATFNSEALTQAGFTILHKQPRSFIIVAKHPAVPGRLFKLYYDTELRIKQKVPGWQWFARRCSGAQLVRNVITKKNIKNFRVPTKHIYVLPPHTIPAKQPGIDPKLAVLVVEDMQLVNKEMNYVAWKNVVTPQVLDELYCIISRANGSSYRPDNIPFTIHGTFAFIDTEYPHRNPDFNSIRPYLSANMCAYWDQLIKKGGPKN